MAEHWSGLAPFAVVLVVEGKPQELVEAISSVPLLWSFRIAGREVYRDHWQIWPLVNVGNQASHEEGPEPQPSQFGDTDFYASVADPNVPRVAASGLVAHTLISRFVDHLPYYWQEIINARSGVQTPRSTLASQSGKAGAAIAPLFMAHKRFVLSCPVLHTDETPVAMLDPGAGKTKRAYDQRRGQVLRRMELLPVAVLGELFELLCQGV